MRPAVRIGLLVVAWVVGAIALILGCLAIYAAVDKVDRFHVEGVELDDPAYLLTLPARGEESFKDPRSGVSVHRLKEGTGAVFARREYSNGGVMTIDDESYEKVTIWIPSGLPQSSVVVDLGDRARAVAVVSRGGSAWPRHDCSGYVDAGTLEVGPRGRRYAVRLKGQFEPTVRVDKHCVPAPVEFAFETGGLSFTQLDPWLGLAGSRPAYEETYR
jgi:hypothetical protein